MLHSHLTTSTATNVYASAVKAVSIQVNAALTGTITVSDETSTAGTPVVAVITNPTVGTYYKYVALRNGVCITPSTTCEITVNVDNGDLGQAGIL